MDNFFDMIGDAIYAVKNEIEYGNNLVRYLLVWGVAANLIALGFVVDWLFY